MMGLHVRAFALAVADARVIEMHLTVGVRLAPIHQHCGRPADEVEIGTVAPISS